MGKATLEWKEIEIVFNIPGGLQGLRNQRQRGRGRGRGRDRGREPM